MLDMRALPAALVLVAAAGCGGGEQDAAAGPEEETRVESSATPSPSASESSTAETTPTGPVAAFDTDALCAALDRDLARRITGPTLQIDEAFRAGDKGPTGAPYQGFTCVLEGGQGSVEASVITVPALVERRKAIDFAAIADCKPADDPGVWDKQWSCTTPTGVGPILLRNGQGTVFTCMTAAKAPREEAVSRGIALCEDLLVKISGDGPA